MMTAIIAVMAILRDRVRALYLEPFTSRFEVATEPQWGNFMLFAAPLVAGLATVAYTVRRVLASPATGPEAT